MTQTILITGTSSGFGKATAELYLARGWNVVATMRRPDPALFAEYGDRVKHVALDVTDAASIDAAIDAGIAAFGAIDVLVNNAGIGLASAIEATPDATVREVFETNTFGVIATCRAIIPVMRRQGRGVIVNVTSSVTLAPVPLLAVYAASKSAVEAFTDALAYELRPFGIAARLVEPGYAPTTRFAANGADRMEGMFPPDYGAYAQAFFAKLADYPLPTCGEDEVAEAVYAAATDEGRTLRYLAGADTRYLAELRFSTSDAEHAARVRELFEPAL